MSILVHFSRACLALHAVALCNPGVHGVLCTLCLLFAGAHALVPCMQACERSKPPLTLLCLLCTRGWATHGTACLRNRNANPTGQVPSPFAHCSAGGRHVAPLPPPRGAAPRLQARPEHGVCRWVMGMAAAFGLCSAGSQAHQPGRLQARPERGVCRWVAAEACAFVFFTKLTTLFGRHARQEQHLQADARATCGCMQFWLLQVDSGGCCLTHAPSGAPTSRLSLLQAASLCRLAQPGVVGLLRCFSNSVCLPTWLPCCTYRRHLPSVGRRL